MKQCFVDIHSHILYGVDDGAKNREASADMLQEAAAQGIKVIIATPHYRHGMFPFPSEIIRKHWQELRTEAELLGIQLLLGCEYHANSGMVENLKSGRCLTLAGSEYVLTEFSCDTEEFCIREQIQTLLSCGYIPVIAHVERYRYFQKHPAAAEEFGRMGAMIQVNAGAVLGQEGLGAKRCVRILLRHRWADIIASDSHNTDTRRNRMGECFEYICRKYGEDYAAALFWDNPGRILPKK